MSIIVQIDQPGFLTGLSAMKTVLENVLGDDPKVDALLKAAFTAETNSILSPLTNLACTACVTSMQQAPGEQSLRTMTIGLDLLKVIVSKLQIGGHISLDVLDLLFSIAETGANHSANSPYLDVALSAMEILTEIMYKRYIPTGTAASSSSSSSSSTASRHDQGVKILMHLVTKTINLLKRYRELGGMEDSAMLRSLLEFIAVFGESHMERCMQSAFSNSNNPNLNQNLHSASSVATADAETAHLQATMMHFFEELVALTTSSMDPQLLHKLVKVWRRLVSIAQVKESILCQQSVCVSVVSHLLSASLLQSNPHLHENMEEMLDALTVNVYVDAHVREILCKISPALSSHSFHSHRTNSSSNSHQTSGGLTTEEHNYIGSALLEDVQELLPELLESRFAYQWLQSALPSLLNANMQQILTESCPSLAYSQACLDARVLIRMIPLIATSLEPILQVLGFMMRVIERHSGHADLLKESVLMLLAAAQMVGQFVQGQRFTREIELTVMCLTSHQQLQQPSASSATTDSASSSSPSSSDATTVAPSSAVEWANHIESIFGSLYRNLETLLGGGSYSSSLRVSDNLQALVTSLLVLYMQTVYALTPMLDLDWFKRYKDSIDVHLTQLLSPDTAAQIQQQCPGCYEELLALCSCARDQLVPTSVSQSCVVQFSEATQHCEALVLAHQQLQLQQQQQQQQRLNGSALGAAVVGSVGLASVAGLWDIQTLDALYHMLATLDVLARHHHILKPAKRQQMVVVLTPIGGLLARFVQCLLYVQQFVWAEFLCTKYNHHNPNPNSNIINNSSNNNNVAMNSHNLSGSHSNGGSRSTSQEHSVLQSATSSSTPNGNNSNGNGSSLNPSDQMQRQQLEQKLAQINRIVRLTITLASELLQRIGKKTFGKAASDVLELCVRFVESCTSPTPDAPCFSVSSITNISSSNSTNTTSLLRLLSSGVESIAAINPENLLALALFDRGSNSSTTSGPSSGGRRGGGCEGVRLLFEVLELSQLVAQSTAASSPTVQSQIEHTQRLLTAILPYLSDEQVCAEILPPMLRAGIVAVNSYWQKAPRSLPFLPSIATASVLGFAHHHPAHASHNPSAAASDTNNNNNNGQNVKELTGVLVTLCVGSLGDAVPPSDTLIALEGLLSLREVHNVFQMQWFQEDDALWASLFARVLRCLILRIHAMHGAELEMLFAHLADSRVAFLLDQEQQQRQQQQQLHESGGGGGDGPGGDTDILQAFWFNLGNEVVKLASALDCGEEAHAYLASALPACVLALRTATQSTNTSAASEAGNCVLQRIVRPVVAVISRRV
jgi:hypothetical protein